MRVSVKNLLGQARVVEVADGASVADLMSAVAGGPGGTCRLYYGVRNRGGWVDGGNAIRPTANVV